MTLFKPHWYMSNNKIDASQNNTAMMLDELVNVDDTSVDDSLALDDNTMRYYIEGLTHNQTEKTNSHK